MEAFDIQNEELMGKMAEKNMKNKKLNQKLQGLVNSSPKSEKSTSIDMTKYIFRIVNSVDSSHSNKNIYRLLSQNFSELLKQSGQEPK